MDKTAIEMIREELDHAIELRNQVGPGTAAPGDSYYDGRVDAFRLALIILGVDPKELPR